MFGPRLRWDKVQDMEIFIFIFKYIPILSDFFSFFLTTPEKCFFLYLNRLGLVGCIQSSLFWINFWCWRGLVRSVVMRRRGAVNDRQAMKVPRLERGERSGLVQLISNELIQWSQTGRDTNNNISHHTPSHHHTITSHHSLNSIWKFVAGCFPVRRESVNNNKQRESSSALRSGLGREKIFKIFEIFLILP